MGFCGNGLLSNHYFLYLYVMGMDARTTLNGVTYAKSLRLSNKARQSTSTGELVTLMSNDAQRLPDMSLSVHAIWSTPLFIIIAVGLLVNLVGAAAAAGVAFLMCMIPIQGFLAAKQMGLQRAQMKQTEARVKVINEVLQVGRGGRICGNEGGGDGLSCIGSEWDGGVGMKVLGEGGGGGGGGTDSEVTQGKR